jgi:sigma-B regulation protein RsbU (phosphoserine phosphatase)
MIVLYTDGVTESRNIKNEEYGVGRLVKILQENASMGSNDIINKIKEDIRIFARGKEQHDDITMNVVKVV